MMRYIQSRAALSAPLLPAAFGALLIAVGFGTSATAQSFDCRNARSADEKTICQESRLGDLDKQLADVYDRAGGKLSKEDREAFEKNETAFVNARHRCGDHRGCIEQSYRNRIQELLSALPEDAAGLPDRADNAKRTDRQKAAHDDTKTEAVQTGADDMKRDTAETSTPPQQSQRQGETKSAVASPSAAVPSPPSRREAEAALAGQPPEKSSRHKRRTESAAVTPAAPEREPPPVASATPVPERHPPKSSNGAATERHPQTGSSTAATEPGNPPEKHHSRARHVASGAPTPPPAPVDQAEPAPKPEIKWVNPAPSP